MGIEVFFEEDLKVIKAKEMLEHGILAVQFFPNADDVIVPPTYVEEQLMVLNFSYRFGIEDFECDEEGIRASLSFRGRSYFCSIPWKAVFSLHSETLDKSYFWPMALPEEMVREWEVAEEMAQEDLRAWEAEMLGEEVEEIDEEEWERAKRELEAVQRRMTNLKLVE